MKPIVILGKQKVKTIETNKKNRVIRTEFDIITKYQEKQSYRSFYADKTYHILVFGDPEKVNDIDLKLFYKTVSSWQLVKEDKLVNSEAEIEFSPKESGLYRIDIHAFKFSGDYDACHYGIIIYYNEQ